MKEVGKTTPEQSLPRMREIIASGRGFWLTVTGRSMAPFLRPIEDRVYIAPLAGKPLRGDVLFAECGEGKLVLHRVYRVGDGEFWLNGDAQNYVEGPFPDECIIGIMTNVIGKNGSVRRIGKAARFGGRLWMLTRRFRPALHGISGKMRH